MDNLQHLQDALTAPPTQEIILVLPPVNVNPTNIDEITDSNLLQWTDINYQEEPPEGNWAIIPLYKRSQTGTEIVWQIGFDSSSNQLNIVFGQVGGKIQKDIRDVKLNTTGRDYKEQAILEARARWNNKFRSGYRPSGETYNLIDPQLAATYIPPNTKWDKKKNKWKNTNIRTFPVLYQAKIDGYRGVTYPNNDPNEPILIRSRETKTPFKWLSEPKKQLAEFINYLPRGSLIDGELYLPEHSFNTLSSAVKTIIEEHPLNKDVQYYIFDMIDIERLVSEKRYLILFKAWLKYLADRKIKGLGEPSHLKMLGIGVANSHEELHQHHNYYASNGYEGLMIRKIAGPNPTAKKIKEAQYRSGRNNSLLKFKQFEDEEGTIIELVESDERDTTGNKLAKFKIRDDLGNEFEMRPAGTFEERLVWTRNPSLVLGRRYTYRFFERYPDTNAPRFPTGVGFGEQAVK